MNLSYLNDKEVSCCDIPFTPSLTKMQLFSGFDRCGGLNVHLKIGWPFFRTLELSLKSGVIHASKMPFGLGGKTFVGDITFQVVMWVDF
jgi:hypothetical protein